MAHIPRFRLNSVSTPIILLVLCLLAFAPLITGVGFYWDDWAKLAVDPIYGPSGYWDYYAGDRPISGWTHIVFNFILGRTPLAWQIAVLTLRWLSAVGVWLTVRKIWQGRNGLAVLTAILFTVHPVFTLQPIAVTFHQQWLQFSLYFFSVWLMLDALDHRGSQLVFRVCLSILLMAVELSVTEYFLTLECSRPVILLIALTSKSANNRQLLKRTLFRSLPYLTAIGVYLVYRLFLIRLPGEDPYSARVLYSLLTQPLHTLQTWGGIFAADLYHIFISTWLEVFNYRPPQGFSRFDLLMYGSSLAAGVVVYIFVSRTKDSGAQNTPIKRAKWTHPALLGLAAAILGILPGWSIGRFVLENAHGSRYALASTFGLSLLLAATIEWFIADQSRRAIAAALLVAFSTGFHLVNTNVYRWVWTDQLRFYWQLSWRAPYLLPQTALVLETEPFSDQGLFSTSAAINLLYPQPSNSRQVAYWVYTLLPRFAEKESNPRLHHFNARFRSFSYQGEMSNSLFLYWNPAKANCLWLLTQDDLLNPYVSEFSKTWLHPDSLLTNLNRIQEKPPAAGYPPRDYFGAPPEQGWCKWFESADLAVQFNRFEEAAQLGDQARAAGYSPARSSSNSPREWLPFIRAYARVNRWEDARDLTIQSIEKDPNFGGMLCRAWEDLTENMVQTSESVAARLSVFDHLGCLR